MRHLPPIPFTSAVSVPRWFNFHHTIGNRRVPAYLTPGLGAEPLPDPTGPGGSVARTEALNAILTYCMADPPQRLCTVGSRWSLSNVLEPRNVILDPGAWNHIVAVDRQWLTDDYRADAASRSGTAIIAGGGTQIRVLNNFLGQFELALQTTGASDGHRIAGCIATGTHGSHPKVGAVHDTVLAIYLVTAPGEATLLQPTRRRFTPELAQWFQDNTSLSTKDVADDDLFDAARVALGSLGFVHSVILETVPLYELQGQTIAAPLFDDAIWDAMETLDTRQLDARPAPDFFSVVLAPYADVDALGAYATILWKQPPSQPFRAPDTVPSVLSSDLSRLLSALIPVVDGALTSGAIAEVVTAVTEAQYEAGSIDPVFPGAYFGPTSLPEGNGRSIEVAINHVNTRAALQAIITALRAEGDAGRHLLGAIGVRFVCPGTTALLGMNIHAMNTYLELPSLDSADTNRIHSVVWHALRAAHIPFTCHWGQESEMDAASVRAFFGGRVNRWKAARRALLPSAAQRAVFSTPLLHRVGLDE